MAIVAVSSDGDWPDAINSRLGTLSRSCSMSALSLTQSTNTLQHEADSTTFMMYRAIRLLEFVRSGLDCRASSVALPNCDLARESAGLASSCGGAELFLAHLLGMLCLINCFRPSKIGPINRCSWFMGLQCRSFDRAVAHIGLLFDLYAV